MVRDTRKNLVIDLNQFKLHLSLQQGSDLTLHFDSPSRRFYLSVISLVLIEMKKQNRIASISIQEHLDALILLNKTIGASAGSSKKKYILSRIYRKWKDALPDLENAPLFRVIGRKKNYGESMEKIYLFSEEEKDIWANLFDYTGSHENVRLKFSIDRLLVSLDDAVILYGENRELADTAAWNSFLKALESRLEKKVLDGLPKSGSTGSLKAANTPETNPVPTTFSRHRWILLFLIVLVMGSSGLVIWQNRKAESKIEPASIDKMAYPLPENPSIAVLPFLNISKDPGQEYFSDGITEYIITFLSKVPYLLVIGRTSAFSYKNRPREVRQISEELGVQYILKGSVLRLKDRVRITARLIDALSGQYIWAESYDRNIEDIFGLQDDIAMQLMAAMQIKLTAGHLGGSAALSTKNIRAYELLLKGYHQYWLRTEEGNTQAKLLASEAISLDSEYCAAYVLLARAYLADVWDFRSNNPSASLKRAEDLITTKSARCSEQNDTLHQAHAVLLVFKGQYDAAVEKCKKVLELRPNSAEANYRYGMGLRFIGKFDEAIHFFRKAIRLDPVTPVHYSNNLALAYLFTGRYQNAVSLWEKITRQNPDYFQAFLGQTMAYQLMGAEIKARESAAQVLRLNPKLTVSMVRKTAPATRNLDRERFMEALHKSGIPE